MDFAGRFMVIDDDDDYHDWGPRPTIELAHKSIDFNLFMWKTGDRYSVILWERRGDADRMLRAYAADDEEEAMHLFASFMNEWEMYK
jgi:hypothetical protein